MNRSIEALITLLLGFWCSTITLFLFRTFSIAPWLDSKLAFVADSGSGTASFCWLETATKPNYEVVIKPKSDVKLYSLS